ETPLLPPSVVQEHPTAGSRMTDVAGVVVNADPEVAAVVVQDQHAIGAGDLAETEDGAAAVVGELHPAIAADVLEVAAAILGIGERAPDVSAALEGAAHQRKQRQHGTHGRLARNHTLHGIL